MAIYQFSIEFIPETWANDNNYNPVAFYDEDGDVHDSSIAWKGFIYDSEINNDISKILPPGKSWCKKILAGEIIYHVFMSGTKKIRTTHQRGESRFSPLKTSSRRQVAKCAS